MVLVILTGCSACRTPLPETSLDPLGETIGPAAEPPLRGVVQASFEEAAEPLFESPQDTEPLNKQPFVTELSPRRLASPRGLKDIDPAKLHPISLDEVMQRARANSQVIRDAAQFLSPNNPLLSSPESVPSEIDPQIFSSGPLGAEAALAAFDAQVSSGIQRRRDSFGQTSSFLSGGLSPVGALTSNSGSAYGRVTKADQQGGLLSLVHNWDYAPNSFVGSGFNSRYVGFLGAEYRRPLLAGRGAGFTSVAGPSTVTGGRLGRGVRVGQLEQRIASETYNAQAQTFLRQAQDAYWDYWLAYGVHGRQSVARDHAAALLERVRARKDAGLPGGDASNLAQAEDAHLLRQGAVNNTLADLLDREARLRRLIGLPVGGGGLLVPSQRPFDGELILDWQGAVTTALTARPELRRQQLRIEVLGLQAAAAADLVRPRLDLIAGAQVNGFGDDLFGGGYRSLLGTQNTGWSLGAEFSSPLARRARVAQRRQLEQLLSKARRVYAAQQDEIRHEVAHCFREVDRAYQSLLLAKKRQRAAVNRQRAAEADFDAGRSSVDLLLRAQSSLAEAEHAHLRGLADYSKAIVELQYREGVQTVRADADVRPTPVGMAAARESGHARALATTTTRDETTTTVRR